MPVTVSSLPNIATSPIPFTPSVVMPLESPTAPEVTHEVLNQEVPILSNPIHYPNVNHQNTSMGIQHFNNHNQCVE